MPEGKLVATLEAIPQDLPYVAIVRSYIEGLRANVEAGRGLLLWGPYRSGKSCLAALIVGEGLAHRLDTYWVEAFDVTDAWIGKSSRGRREALRGSQLLVVDDLGMESKGASDYPTVVMQDLLKYRLERLRPTILTTNMGPTEVKKTYGDKMWALLQEYVLEVSVRGAESFWKGR